MRISGVGCGIVDQEFGAFQKINSVGEDWTTNAQLGAGITDVFEMSTADAGAWKRIFEVELPLIAGAACFSDDHTPRTGSLSSTLATSRIEAVDVHGFPAIGERAALADYDIGRARLSVVVRPSHAC